MQIKGAGGLVLAAKLVVRDGKIPDHRNEGVFKARLKCFWCHVNLQCQGHRVLLLSFCSVFTKVSCRWICIIEENI